MRYRSAQVVVLAAASLLAGGRLSAQAVPKIEAKHSCPTSSHAKDKSSDPEVSIAGVTFSGFLQMPVSEQDEVAALIKDEVASSTKEETTGTVSPDDVTELALEITKRGWQERGYFKVDANGYAITLSSTPFSRRIVINIHVNEGLQYSLGGITFMNNRAISDVQALRAVFPIKDGDVLSREKIATGLENLRKAYGEMGYLNSTFLPNPRFNEERKLIYVDIDMDEGKQFYVGGINLTGLDDAAQQELLKDLPITKGQIFNSRLWALSLLRLGSRLPDCGCAARQVRALDERAGIVTLTFDLRPCSAGE